MKNTVGLDIGYDTLKLYLPEYDEPYGSEPSLIALNRDGSIAACGEDAKRLSRRIPGGVSLIHPFSGDRSPLPAHSEAFFRYLVKSRRLKGRDLLLSFSGARDDTVERGFVEAAQKAGFRDIAAVDPLFAALNGCGITAAGESAILNLGASVADMGCFVRGKAAGVRTVSCAGNRFSQAIVSYVFRAHKLSLGREEADAVKAAIGTLSPTGALTYEAVAMRPAVGLPKKITLTENEISAALEGVFDELADEILSLVRGLRAEPDKIILTGGTARLKGLASALAPLLCLPITSPQEPEMTVIRGLAALIRGGV